MRELASVDGGWMLEGKASSIEKMQQGGIAAGGDLDLITFKLRSLNFTNEIIDISNLNSSQLFLSPLSHLS